MFGEWFLGFSLGLALLQAGQDDVLLKSSPRSAPELSPRPRVNVAQVYPVSPFFAADPYWRVRLYAHDRFGQLRPRVILGPYGAYWPLTGEPYPFTSVRGIQ